ncbi:MAG TPA: serine/threonine-protein kinase [Thermoanaerobaculia bacterium]|nr:serine/threonine-protein kinase [Thermoanaerobaculia bacterium]
MIGRRVGSWVLEREIGRGGMGSVFQARHVSLSTLAAIKVLSPGLESEESFRQRFHREAGLQAQLRHPNVARVLDYFEDGGQWFLVVDYLDRGSLAEVLSREGAKVPRPQAIAWARQALAGLGHAHGKGIVHRDVKPANLLLNESGEVAVADFGIARADTGPGLTTTGVAVGTPQYMSPEQILHPDGIDRRTDVYSLGVVLYEMLAGRKPFDSGSQFSILQAHVSEPPPPLRSLDPGIPPALEAVVMRALAKKPEERYPDCESMIRDLDRAAELREAVAQSLPRPEGATVRATSLFTPPPVPEHGPVASPAERSATRRRSFQWRLMAGASLALVVAAFLAFQMARRGDDAEPPVIVPDKTDPQISSDVEPPPEDEPQQEPRKDKDQKDQKDRKDERDETGRMASQEPEDSSQGEVVKNEEKKEETKVPPPPPPPPPAPALPEHPRIAVLATGDPLLAGSLEQEIERRLLRKFDVADEHGEADVDELLAREGDKVSQKALGEQLLRSGFQVLVLLRVEEAEKRTEEVFGVSGSIKAARMRLNAYLLPANRSLGRGWTETVEYTELSAPAKAKLAFIGPTADLMQAIEQDWNQLRAATAAAPAR